jgi:hypothetical protein
VRVASALGTIELWLPDGQELAADPGVADGEMLYGRLALYLRGDADP